jgi:hypothetical protein
MATPALLRLAVRVVVFLLVLGLVLGAAVFGVPIGYYWWMQFQCWRAGPDSDPCWWLDLLEHPDKPREAPGRSGGLPRPEQDLDRPRGVGWLQAAAGVGQ